MAPGPFSCSPDSLWATWGRRKKEYQAGDEFKLVRPFGLVSKSAWQRLLGVTHVAIMAQWKGCSLWDLGMLR